MTLLLWAQHTQSLDAGRRLTGSYARVIEEQTTRTIQTIDERLQLAALGYAQLAADGTPPEATARAFLRSQARLLPFVRAIWMTDATGTMRFDSDSVKLGIDVSDRDYFTVFRGNPQLAFSVANPIRSRTDGSWLLSASRPIRAADGSFAGVIVAAIRLLYLDDLWRTLDLGANGAVSLVRVDGTMLMRSPFDSLAVGQNFSAHSSFTAIRAASSGHYGLVSPVDGIERDVAFRHLALLPDIAVLVGQSYDAIIAPWRRFALFVLLGWGLAAAATAAWAGTATMAPEAPRTRRRSPVGRRRTTVTMVSPIAVRFTP